MEGEALDYLIEYYTQQLEAEAAGAKAKAEAERIARETAEFYWAATAFHAAVVRNLDDEQFINAALVLREAMRAREFN